MEQLLAVKYLSGFISSGSQLCIISSYKAWLNFQLHHFLVSNISSLNNL